MVSKCPSCKKENEHEDFLFEVLCSCGIRFNPFMAIEDTPSDPVGATAPPAWQDPPAAAENFQESQSMFEEIKEFAETGKASPNASLVVETPAPTKAKPKPAPRPTAPVVDSPTGDTILTSGDGLPGYRIDHYFPPVSAAAELDPNDPNPMRRGFEALWAQAVAEGANGVVAVRWVLSPDGSRVVLSGTPVQCTKE